MKKAFAALLVCMLVFLPLSGQSDKNYTSFISIVKKELKACGIKKYEEHFAERYFVVTEENDCFDAGSEVGLENLYQLCLQNDKSQWKSIVQKHFASVKVTRSDEKEIFPKLETFEGGRQYVKIRIYPADFLDAYAQSSIVDSSNEDFIGVVVIDFPHAIKNLPKDYAAKWAMTEKELLDFAIANTVGDNKERFEDVEISGTFTVSTLLSDSNMYVTSSIYKLKDIRDGGTPYGSFVAVPNRYGILVKDIDKDSAGGDAVQLALLAAYMYRQGPGSITDSVYWFDGEKLHKVGHDRQSGTIRLPDKLTQLLR